MLSKDKYILNKAYKLSDEEILQLEAGSEKLLSKCINPDSDEFETSTGIAIGKYKVENSSMEMLSHMARDKGFKIIIVLSGTTEVLTKQTQSRFYEFHQSKVLVGKDYMCPAIQEILIFKMN